MSSSFVASWVIRETLKHNVDKASDITLDTVRDNIYSYMDDLIFSLDDSKCAETVVEESIKLFSSRKFDLVKWSSSRDEVVSLWKIDKEKLCLGIRDIDLSVEYSEELPFKKTLGCVWDTDTDSFRI